MPVEFTVVSYLARRGLGKQGEASPGKELGDSARMVKPIGIAHQGRRDVHSESGARERGAKVKDRPTVRGWKGRKRIAFVPSVNLFFRYAGPDHYEQHRLLMLGGRFAAVRTAMWRPNRGEDISPRMPSL